MNAGLTALIVDDEPYAQLGLKELIDNNLPVFSKTDIAENAQNALEKIIDSTPHILFLDIQMPVHNGFWLADKLSKLKIDTNIIFVTAYDEYAIEAIRHSAFDFLLKPIDYDELKAAVNRYLDLTSKEQTLDDKVNRLNDFFNRERLKFNTQKGVSFLYPDEIVYCEAKHNYTLLHLINGKQLLTTMQLGKTEKVLKDKGFLRISRSFLINKGFIEIYNRKRRTVTLTDTLQKYELKTSFTGSKRLLKL